MEYEDLNALELDDFEATLTLMLLRGKDPLGYPELWVCRKEIDMKPEDMETLEKIAQFEDQWLATMPAERTALGWDWRDVRVYPATLNRLVVEGLLDTKFKSNSYTGYLLSESARALLI